jgi:hypothetical protein
MIKKLFGIKLRGKELIETKKKMLTAYTVKLVWSDPPWDPKKVAAIKSGRCLEPFFYYMFKWELEMVVVIDRWSLFGTDR